MTFTPLTINSKVLRQQAEQALLHRGVAIAVEGSLTRTSHELMVTRVELEIQNEHLKNALAELEEARLRYEDLFDYAPVGYITLDLQGSLTDANLAAIFYLGMDKAPIVTRRSFSDFVSPEDRARWEYCLNSIRTGSHHAACELTLTSEDGRATHVMARLAATPTLPEMPVRVALIELAGAIL